MQNITIFGGGNIGTQFACQLAIKGYCVNIYTSKPQTYNGTLEIVDEDNKIIEGKINKATSNINDAMEQCDAIFITHPAFMFSEDAKLLLPFIKKGLIIFVIPGTGGAEFAFKECIEKGAILAGLQRVPSVARLEEYGRRVRCEGYRDQLYLGSIPHNEALRLSSFMENIWDIKCNPLPNYLCVTLTPSNPILHTSRLATMYEDYSDGTIYDNNPLFYGEWTDKSSKRLINCDQELQNICKAMNKLDLHDVRSLKLHYESETIEAMTKKLSSIKSLHNLKSPMIQVKNGWIPDFSSRYFTADFPYGLAIIESLAEILKIDVPNIKKTMDWYYKVTGNTKSFNLKDYGINDLTDIYKFYSNL